MLQGISLAISYSKPRMEERGRRQDNSLCPLLGTCPGNHPSEFLSHPTVIYVTPPARKAVFILGPVTFGEGKNGCQHLRCRHLPPRTISPAIKFTLPSFKPCGKFSDRAHPSFGTSQIHGPLFLLFSSVPIET